MKIGTITFHSAHNYGSMLQAYALRQTIINMGHNCEVINFRSHTQKQIYKVISGRKGVGPFLKDLSHILFYRKLKKKFKLFETFLHDEIISSAHEYNTVEELYNANFNFDIVICGSDQIWKPTIADFSWAYLLPFCDSSKRIAYAPSYGPSSETSMEFKKAFKKYLYKFDAISVREEGTRSIIENLTGMKNIEIVCDPVFLLDKLQWNKIIDNKPIINKPYIFFYTLFADHEMIQIVKQISQKLGLPVIISNFTNLHDLFSGFEMKLECGPREFLNLIKNAEYVCTSSFHGTAFTCLLNKPLISIRGMKDNRIRSILEKFNLQQYAVNNISDVDRVCTLLPYDSNRINECIDSYKQSGMSYLKKHLSND